MKAKKKLWALAVAAIVLAGCPGPDAPYTGPAVITDAAINVTAPATGSTPIAAATAVGANPNFTVSPVTWSPAHNPFQASTVYTATVTLTANADHTFTGLATATINGQAATVTNNTGTAVTLARTFAATGAAAAIVIETAAIEVTAPVMGETPDATATVGTGANFTAGDVTWNPAHSPFRGGTVYTATVTLTANAGYTFASGPATATINGQPATMTNNTVGTVTLALEFPATALDPLIAAWQFGTVEGTAVANNQAVSASIEYGNASRPSGGQQAETARLRFWVSPEGVLPQRALNASGSGINVRNAADGDSGGLDGLANNAWWQTYLSTTGRTDIAVTWRMRSTNTAPRDWRLQYRIGSTGEWNNVGGTIALPLNPYASTLSAPEQGRFLPASAENHERLYLRWLMTSNIGPNGNPIQPGGTHQINDIVIRSGADSDDFDNNYDCEHCNDTGCDICDPPPQTGTFTINWTGFTNPQARGVTITGDSYTGVISINDPNDVIISNSIQWLNDNMIQIGSAATLGPDNLPPLLTVRVRTIGSDRTYSIVFDTVTGNVF